MDGSDGLYLGPLRPATESIRFYPRYRGRVLVGLGCVTVHPIDDKTNWSPNARSGFDRLGASKEI